MQSNMRQCPEGHWWNADLYSECDICASMRANSSMGLGSGAGPTVPVSEDMVSASVPHGSSGGETKPSYTPYVVGWLVALDGAYKGQDFKLHGGANVIGRGADSDINLADDSMVSKSSVRIMFYPDTNEFIASELKSENSNPIYYNGRAFVGEKYLAMGDKIKVGETTLFFVPLCAPAQFTAEPFSWAE